MADQTSAADFVARFAEVWADPDPDRLNGLVHADVEFIQPLEGTVRGHRETREFWQRLFSMIPDAHGEVLSWAEREGVVFIELRISGTLGGRPIDWVTLDRIRLEDGKVRQRIAYFDPLPIVSAVVRRPRALGGWLRANAGRLLPTGRSGRPNEP
jgi:ketosteroid isomerase-like protein